MRTLAMLSICLVSACASGGVPTGDVPAPSPQAAGSADACGGLYALDVRNDGDEDVGFSFTDAKLLRPAQQIGLGPVRGKDATTLFFRSPEPPAVWANTRGARVSIDDRAGLQRYRIRVTLRCDAP
ncbi:MAG: hypothetical protein OEW06_05845 [Gemmatimonadota bacterium]|nr:hypothetical protein [Gemmatimonadota bacterium]MDH4351990.1 hypothetical protein [Gemmatimonadota bacterium]